MVIITYHHSFSSFSLPKSAHSYIEFYVFDLHDLIVSRLKHGGLVTSILWGAPCPPKTTSLVGTHAGARREPNDNAKFPFKMGA
jgi:hypothetical protein